MRLKYFGVMAIVLILNFYSFAQAPKVPVSNVGACSFECYPYRQWTAKKETTLYKQMRDDSPITFKIKRREKVTG